MVLGSALTRNKLGFEGNQVPSFSLQDSSHWVYFQETDLCFDMMLFVNLGRTVLLGVWHKTKFMSSFRNQIEISPLTWKEVVRKGRDAVLSCFWGGLRFDLGNSSLLGDLLSLERGIHRVLDQVFVVP